MSSDCAPLVWSGAPKGGCTRCDCSTFAFPPLNPMCSRPGCFHPNTQHKGDLTCSRCDCKQFTLMQPFAPTCKSCNHSGTAHTKSDLTTTSSRRLSPTRLSPARSDSPSALSSSRFLQSTGLEAFSPIPSSTISSNNVDASALAPSPSPAIPRPSFTEKLATESQSQFEAKYSSPVPVVPSAIPASKPTFSTWAETPTQSRYESKYLSSATSKLNVSALDSSMSAPSPTMPRLPFSEQRANESQPRFESSRYLSTASTNSAPPPSSKSESPELNRSLDLRTSSYTLAPPKPFSMNDTSSKLQWTSTPSTTESTLQESQLKYDLKYLWDHSLHIQAPKRPTEALLEILAKIEGHPNPPDHLIRPSQQATQVQEPTPPDIFDSLVIALQQRGLLQGYKKPELPPKPPSMTWTRYYTILRQMKAL